MKWNGEGRRQDGIVGSPLDAISLLETIGTVVQKAAAGEMICRIMGECGAVARREPPSPGFETTSMMSTVSGRKYNSTGCDLCPKTVREWLVFPGNLCKIWTVL